MQKILQLIFASAGVAVFSHAFPGIAAVANITVVNFAFSPVSTNIAAGDKVIWTWSSGDGATPHTTTSDTNGLWDSGSRTFPASFTNTFALAGVYPYHCTFHGVAFNMKGSINVATVNVPPSVTITNPVSGAVFSAPASVTIQASASDSDGTVTNVQFLIGSSVLTNEAAAPFSAVTNNLAAGSYTFSAVVTDNAGLTATNAISISVVTPVTLTISSPQLSSTNFQFSYAANVGLSYIVQLSTNLSATNWLMLATNTAASNPVIFTDKQATNNRAFYRVGLLPNP
jgi:plastocyanin